MSRLIDADALERDGWQMSRTVRVSKDTMEYQVRKPTDFPAIEPQRMRGKWIDGHRMSFDGTFHWYRMCSECDYERDDDNIDMDTNFCPNCGADMRGEQNEDDRR